MAVHVIWCYCLQLNRMYVGAGRAVNVCHFEEYRNLEDFWIQLLPSCASIRLAECVVSVVGVLVVVVSPPFSRCLIFGRCNLGCNAMKKNDQIKNYSNETCEKNKAHKYLFLAFSVVFVC